MGEVYRAHDPRIGRDVAIKILPPAVAEDPERLRRFEREAHAAGALNHPNLLTVFELGKHEGSPYLVSELLDGTTLAALLLQPPLVDPLQDGRPALSMRRVLDYAIQIASGLAAAHEKGIVHRDLKPENIFVTGDNRVKLVDFGLAKIVSFSGQSDANSDRTTTPGAIVGTCGYMAPEQVRGEAVDHRADIFAFGVVLYQMVTGIEPFRRDTAVETMSAVIRDDPKPIPVGAVPPALARVVTHALAKNPSMRFQSMRDVAFTLEVLASTDDGNTLTPRKMRKGRSEASPTEASFNRITFRRGFVMGARFAPDGSIVYGAAWEDRPLEIFTSHPGNPESRPLGLPAGDVLAVSRNGDLAVSLGRRYVVRYVTQGVLARVPLTGGAPRELCESVQDADWTPDGKELLVTRCSGDHFRIELPLGHVVYETRNWVSGARFSPRGDLIAFTEHPVWGDDAGSLMIIDRAGAVKLRSEPWWSISGPVWPPTGNEVWCSVERHGAGRDIVAFSVNGKTRTVLAAPGRFQLKDITPDGRVLVIFDNLRREMMGGTRSDPRERNLSWFDWPLLTGLAHDGSRIAFEEQGAARGSADASSIYMRPTNGGPAVHLCEGRARAIAPDGKSVVVMTAAPPKLMMVPTGAGETRPLDVPGLKTFTWGEFNASGSLLVVLGAEEGCGERLYAIDLAGGAPPRAVSSQEGVSWPFAVAPDGSAVAAAFGDQIFIYPIDGSPPLAVEKAREGERVVAWSSGGEALFVCARGRVSVDIARIEIATGTRTLWYTIRPSDPAGIMEIYPVKMTPDGEHYVYGYRRSLADLLIVRGLLA